MLEITEQGLIKDTNTKCAIVGSASSSKDLAPFHDYQTSIFSLAWRQDVPRTSVAFDIHRINYERVNVPKDYIGWLSNIGAPVFLQEKHPQISNSHKYPLDYMVSKFGDYFVCSIAYMIAMAIESGYKEIALYGVDLIHDSEFEYQRPNAEFLLGWARGAGITLVIPNTSALLKTTHRYGYEKPPSNGVLDEDLLSRRIASYDESFDEARKKALVLDGARQEARELLALMNQTKRGKINV